MRFWEWFTNLYLADRREEKESNDEVLPVYPDMIVELEVADRQYIIDEFKISFYRNIDKADPNDIMRRGTIMIEMNGAPDTLCMNWSVSSLRRYDGALFFYSCKDCLKTGMTYSIVFTGASCVGLERHREGATESTRMYIAPESVLIGNEKWDSYWK